MAAMDEKWYRARAVEEAAKLLPERGEAMQDVAIKVDPQLAEVSKGTNPGGWVQAWLWIPDPPPKPDVPPEPVSKDTIDQWHRKLQEFLATYPGKGKPPVLFSVDAVPQDAAGKADAEEKAQHGYETSPPGP